ncbi:unnamed protein product [Prunus armeniaca]
MPPSAKKKSNAPLEPHEQLLEPPILLPWLLELDALIRIDPPTARIVALTCQTKTFPKPPTVMTVALDLQETDPIAPIVMTMVITSIPTASFTGQTKDGMQSIMSSLSDLQIQQMLAIMHDKPAPDKKSQVNAAATNKVTFFPYWCILHDLVTRKMIGLGMQHGRLYYLVALLAEKPPNTTHQYPSHRPSCNHTVTTTDLWRLRLGHVSSSRLNFMSKHLIDFPFVSNNACHGCPLAKQSLLPFGTSSISSVKTFVNS